MDSITILFAVGNKLQTFKCKAEDLLHRKDIKSVTLQLSQYSQHYVLDDTASTV